MVAAWLSDRLLLFRRTLPRGECTERLNLMVKVMLPGEYMDSFLFVYIYRIIYIAYSVCIIILH